MSGRGSNNSDDLQALNRLSAGAARRMELVELRARLCKVLREELAQAEQEHDQVLAQLDEHSVEDHQRATRTAIALEEAGVAHAHASLPQSHGDVNAHLNTTWKK